MRRDRCLATTSTSCLAPEWSPMIDAGHECPNDAAAHEFARLSAGLFVSDLLLLGTFEQYCFEVVTEDGGASLFSIRSR